MLKNNSRLFIAAPLIAATVLFFAGCGQPVNAPTTTGLSSANARLLVASGNTDGNGNYTGIDPMDGLFVTFWVAFRNQGSVTLNTTPGAYTMTTSGNFAAPNQDTVVGKGIGTSFGETINWTTNRKDNTNYSGVYGWLQDPLVEYYIGNPDLSGYFKNGVISDSRLHYAGTYATSRGQYTMYVFCPDWATNILNPGGKKDGSLPMHFLQFDCVGPTGGPVNLSEHFAAWQNLLQTFPMNSLGPDFQGLWQGHITTTNYCVAAIESQQNNANASISNITISDSPPLTPRANFASGYYLIRNRWTGEYLNVAHMLANGTLFNHQAYSVELSSTSNSGSVWQVKNQSNGNYQILSNSNGGVYLYCPPPPANSYYTTQNAMYNPAGAAVYVSRSSWPAFTNSTDPTGPYMIWGPAGDQNNYLNCEDRFQAGGNEVTSTRDYMWPAASSKDWYFIPCNSAGQPQ